MPSWIWLIIECLRCTKSFGQTFCGKPKNPFAKTSSFVEAVLINLI